MSRHITRTRRVGQSALVLSVASIALASCGSAATALRADGQPSNSINVPLTSVGCTSSGACIALGTTGSASNPTTTAQVRNRRGVWSTLNVPAAPVALVYDGSCASALCFFVGTRNTGELLWRINAGTGTVSSLAGPSGGLVIRQVSCVNDDDCVVLDQGANAVARLSSTSNAGATWSPPRTLHWAAGSTTVLSCTSNSHCVIATTSPQHRVTLRQTNNAGLTWILIATPPTWTSVRSLRCTTTCVALVTSATGSDVAAQSTTTTKSSASVPATKALTWSSTPLKIDATALACSTATTCYAVGSLADQTAAMVQWRGGAAHDVNLTYVPSTLNDIACSSSVCVAVAASTVVAFAP